MKRVRIITPALFLLFALSAVGTTAAEASGPVWLVGAKEEVKAGESKTISIMGNLSVIDFIAGEDSVECGKVSKGTTTASEIIGGNPGTGKAEILFKECHQESKPNCLATGTAPAATPGEIITQFKTLLVYLASFTNGENAFEAFFPEESHLNIISTFKFENKTGTTECGSLNGTEIHLAAVGTEIEIPTFKEKRKCAALTHVGGVESGKFKATKPREMSLKGALYFQEVSAEYWTGTGFAKLECQTWDLVGANHIIDEERGELDFTLETGPRPVGWDV